MGLGVQVFDLIRDQGRIEQTGLLGDNNFDCLGYTALLAGGGIKGGYVYGASDRSAAHVKERPVSPEDFGATLFHALGVRPETRLGADGFTRPASTGQPVLDLFA
jgi:hypothetical protein